MSLSLRTSALDLLSYQQFSYILIAVESTVRIYWASTCRLLHALRVGTGHQVVGYKICPINLAHLYIITSSGHITKWEWASGKLVCGWETHCKTIAVDVASDVTGNSHLVSFFCLQEQEDGKRHISMVRLADEDLVQFLILDTPKNITGIRIAHRGQVVVAWGRDHILNGSRQRIDHPVDISKPVQYTWLETRSPIDITCVDIREGTVSRERQNTENSNSLDLVLGSSGGSVLVLYDTLNCVPNGKGETAFRRLHWHRGAVNVVRWSRDGTFNE